MPDDDPRPPAPLSAPTWHDRDVARAADAWLNEPRDTTAYTRLVEAILRRRAYLHPTLINEQGDAEELTDHLGDDRAPVALGDLVRQLKPRLGQPTSPPT